MNTEPVYYEEPYTPLRIVSPSPTVGSCHYLYSTFNTQFSQYACKGSAAICAGLQWAENYTRGFVIETSKRDFALMLLLAHFFECSAIVSAETQARLVQMVDGGASSNSSEPMGDEWLGRSLWGQMFLGLARRNARLGVLVV